MGGVTLEVGKCGHKLWPTEALVAGRRSGVFCKAPGKPVEMSKPGRPTEPQTLCGPHVAFYRARGWTVKVTLEVVP